MSKTKLSKKHQYVIYTSKHLRLDLYDKLRIQAALRNETMEDVLNLALEFGLPAVVQATRQILKAGGAA